MTKKQKFETVASVLGFENITGTLYRHKEIGIVSFVKIEDIPYAIFEAGRNNKAEQIRNILNVKER